jgi:transcriptional regulator with XRE-family HTH domain
MATLLGFSKSSYSRYERGEQDIHFEDLTRISKILDVPIHEFLPETMTIHNENNSHQSGLIFGNIYNYYDRTEYTKELELKIKYLENENLSLRNKLASGD